MTVRVVSRLVLCASGLIAVLFVGCALSAPAGAPTPAPPSRKAEVEFRIIQAVELKDGHAIAVTFGDGRGTRTLAQDGFSAIQEGHAIAGPFETATTGELKVTGALVDRDGRELAQGAVDLPLEPDWRYGVWVMIANGDPTAGCLGCAGSRTFPLDPALGYAPDVTLAIVWGTNSISEPVVY